MFVQDLLQFHVAKALVHKLGVFGGQLSRRSVDSQSVYGGQLPCTNLSTVEIRIHQKQAKYINK